MTMSCHMSCLQFTWQFSVYFYILLVNYVHLRRHFIYTSAYPFGGYMSAIYVSVFFLERSNMMFVVFRTLQTLFHYLKTEKEVDTDALWDSMKDLVIKTIISGEASISSLTKANVTSRYNCYELFGIDVLLDEDLKPWLLEVS
jgi:hypothetical protein